MTCPKITYLPTYIPTYLPTYLPQRTRLGRSYRLVTFETFDLIDEEYFSKVYCLKVKGENPTTIQVVCTFRCQTNRTCWLSEKIISQPPEQGIPPFLKRRTLTDNIFIDAVWESNPWWPSTWLAWQTRRASLKCSWDKVPAAQGQLAFPERFLFHLYFWPQKYRNTEIETTNLNLEVSYLYLASLHSRSIH